MLQMFGTGTACVVCPVGRIVHKIRETGEFKSLIIQKQNLDDKMNVMQRLYDTITGIQYGSIPMSNWVQIIE